MNSTGDPIAWLNNIKDLLGGHQRAIEKIEDKCGQLRNDLTALVTKEEQRAESIKSLGERTGDLERKAYQIEKEFDSRLDSVKASILTESAKDIEKSNVRIDNLLNQVRELQDKAKVERGILIAIAAVPSLIMLFGYLQQLQPQPARQPVERVNK